jgi:hypothetical protein
MLLLLFLLVLLLLLLRLCKFAAAAGLEADVEVAEVESAVIP